MWVVDVCKFNLCLSACNPASGVHVYLSRSLNLWNCVGKWMSDFCLDLSEAWFEMQRSWSIQSNFFFCGGGQYWHFELRAPATWALPPGLQARFGPWEYREYSWSLKCLIIVRWGFIFFRAFRDELWRETVKRMIYV
jgi:hypothetical protein